MTGHRSRAWCRRHTATAAGTLQPPCGCQGSCQDYGAILAPLLAALPPSLRKLRLLKRYQLRLGTAASAALVARAPALVALPALSIPEHALSPKLAAELRGALPPSCHLNLYERA